MKINISNIRTFKELLRNLSTILLNLDLVNNFKGVELVDVSLPANSETKIRHGLGLIPQKKILTKCSNYGIIKNGTTADDENYIYFTNADASEDATISVLLYP